MRHYRSRLKTGALLGALTCLSVGGLMSIAAARPALAWGGEGHSYTADVAVRSLPDGTLKTLFTKNLAWFETNSSYPDRWRNRPDDAEAPRHFLDGERFGFGSDLSKVPHPFGEVLKIRNYGQLRGDGVNPWTIRRHYQLLVDALRAKHLDDIFLEAAYLSHYVADSHVPYHATENYDGQLSTPSQKGVHARFETQLLQHTIKASDLKPGKPTVVTDPLNLAFSTLQDSLNNVPLILAADKEAAAASGGEYNDTYWSAFAAKARPIAVQRLESGGRDLAGLLLTAYAEAGRPALPSSFTMTDRYLPYAPVFVPRGETAPPAQPPVTDEAKADARKSVKTIQIESKVLGKTLSANVLLPKGYDAATRRRYPVLYLLHGAGGSYSNWNTQSGVAAYVADLPLIVVMPDANGNSFYVNSSGKGNVADYFVQELIPAIDKMYRTDARKESRAIAGLSMGGYGAWKLALSNPDLFTATASLSGALQWGQGGVNNPALAPYLTPLYGTMPDPAEYAKGDLLPLLNNQVKKGRYVGPALYFDIGSEDYLKDGNEAIEQFLLVNGNIPYQFAEFKGAHTWSYWDEHIRDVLQFVMRHVNVPE